MDIQKAQEVLARFPRLELGTFPTPLHAMKHMQAKLGTELPLYIKRDDLTGLGAGGNKIRNLEYLLGDMIQKKCDVVLASGKSQSNLCALTVSACCKADLDCIIFHNDQKPNEESGNQLLNRLSRADLRYIGLMSDTEREAYVEQYAQELRQQGRCPYLIKNGASTALGALGYVQAMVELCQQCGAQGIVLKNLFVPGGNGGLATGTIFGAALTQAPFHVHVVTVEHEAAVLKKILDQLLGSVSQLTGQLAGFDFDSVYTIHGDYRGGGWSKATPECVGQIYDLAQTEGIFVEQVYTSKTLYGMLHMVTTGLIDANACYLHTGGFGALFSQF